MKPINLKLKNFKQHKSLDIDFAEGMTLITGDFGSGKSTILEAICVGLWGSSAVKSKAAELANDNATNYEIELLLDTGHLIKRDIKNASVELNGEIVVNSHTAVNKYIEELIGVDRKTFLLINVARQKKTAELLDMEGTELNKFLEGITGVDKLDSIISKAANIGRNNKAKAEGVFESLLTPETLQELNSEKTGLEGQIALAANVLEGYDEELKKIKTTIVSEESILATEDAKWKAYQSFTEANQKLLSEIEISKTELKKLSYVDTSELSNEIDILDKIRVDNLQIVRDSERLASTVEAKKALLIDAEKSLKVLSESEVKDVTPNPEHVTFFKTELALTKVKIAEVTEALESSVCKSCNRPLDNDFEHKEKLIVELSELNDKLDRIKIDGKSAATQLELETKQHNQYAEWQSKINRLEEAVVRYKGEYLDAESELKNLGVVKPFDRGVYEAKINELNTHLQNNKSWESWTSRLNTATKKYESLSIVEKPLSDLDDIRAAIKGLNMIYSNLKDEMQSNVSILYQHQTQLGSIDLELTTHSSNEAKYKELIDKAEVYNSLAKVIKDNRTEYITSAWGQILITASEFISTVSGNKITEVLLTEDGLSYRQDDFVRSASLLSGGQSDLVGLGIRMGILQIVPNNFDCVLLDEVSSALDEDASVTLLSIIRNYSNNSIIVSHRAFDCADQQIKL